MFVFTDTWGFSYSSEFVAGQERTLSKFSAGGAVKILSACRQELNGKAGVLEKFDEEKGAFRFALQLPKAATNCTLRSGTV